MHNFDTYQTWTRTSAIYPDHGTGRLMALAYTALGLAGEAGEVANKAKKLLRDGDGLKARNDVRDELGDVLWYLARVADELGVDLATVAACNVDKLELRKATGKIGGSGDHR